MKKVIVVSLIFNLLAVSFSLSHSASDAPKRGGTLTMAIRRDLTVMNPLVRTSSTDRQIRDLMFESLLGLDLKGNVHPVLAESWEMSKDGRIYTFNLRKGVKFHDGREMTAYDAKFVMDYTMNPKNGAYGYDHLTIVERVDAPDKHTLRVYLKKTSPSFLYLLSNIQAFSVIPRGSLEEGVLQPARYPVGTGPFRFSEWKPRQQLLLERYEDYWGHRAFVDRMILRPISDNTVRITALRAGDVDLIEAAPYEWVRQIVDGKLKGINYGEAAYAGFRVLKFNVAAPPFDNKKLRQAVAHALDKREFLQASFNGFGKPTDQRYPKGHVWHFEEVSAPAYDLERARALLKEAGYQGETLDLHTIQGEDAEAATIQAQLRRIGMNVKPTMLDASTQAHYQRTGQFAFRVSGGSFDADPSLTLAPNFACPVDLKKRTTNTPGYCDKEMDALLQSAETEVDPGKRRELVRRIVEKVAEDLPEIPIGFVPRFFALRDHVKGFSTDSEGVFRWLRGGLSYTWLDK